MTLSIFTKQIAKLGALLALSVVVAFFVSACGGGSGGSALAPPPCLNCGPSPKPSQSPSPSPSASPLPSPSPSPSLSPSPSPPPSPSPSPSPSSSPVNCAVVRSAGFHSGWRVRLLPTRVAAVPARIGPGPASPACSRTAQGRARCTAWVRTDIARPLGSGPAGYGPADLQSAYSLAGPSSLDGAGQTVAVVDAYDDPKAEADLAVYRSTFALSACTSANGCFVKVNQSGATSPLPGTDPTGGWEAEESLDLDMVSAICPNCNIVLVEADSPNNLNLFTAEDTAASTCGATVISNSWGESEYPSEVSDEAYFNHPGVMITVSAGDNGYGPPGSGYPAASQYVTSVGGTSLFPPGIGWTQSVWSGSGSLCSQYITQPSWQTNLGPAYTSVCGKRIDNDVSAVADPNTGVAVYDTVGGVCSAWCVFGGTSASAPIIGAVYALAGNGAAITYGSFPYGHSASLTDVTSGSNGSCGGTYLCAARSGFDGPTGGGTPNGIGAF
jgi:hypothetical protein